ncbi:hypothetical protein [Synechococcus sp. CB0205]|uniref:hypothetical protein n=1 Tax=Synechococcus sp. CB0205 TaxID=232363 RepID=UPI0012EAF83B|nr:hypothetical protein [Synechococcus sp. CB0205]
MLSVIFLYYTVAGPLHALQQGDWTDRGVDLRYGMEIAWQGAAISFAAFLVSYGLIRQQLPPPRRSTGFDSRQAWRLGQTLNVLGITFFGLLTGPRLLFLLNPLTARQVEAVGRGLDFGPFANYAGLAVNFLIPGILLLTAVWASQRRGGLQLLLWLIAASGIYTTLGFRYRLALLFSGVLLVFYLARGRQPRAGVVIPAVAGLLGLAGLIGLTRSYGRGLNLSGIEGLGFWDLVLAGFGESGIFLTSGGVMALTPSDISYVGITPLVNTVLFPIPSQLLPGKDSAAYLLDATAVVYNSSVHNAGAAFLNYAEYFLMGGWPALIVGYLLLGWLCRRLWLWFLWRRQEPIAQVTYVCAVTFLYVVVSRGYLPQVVMLFGFTVLPLFFYYYRISRPVLRHDPRSAPAAQPR